MININYEFCLLVESLSAAGAGAAGAALRSDLIWQSSPRGKINTQIVFNTLK